MLSASSQFCRKGRISLSSSFSFSAWLSITRFQTKGVKGKNQLELWACCAVTPKCQVELSITVHPLAETTSLLGISTCAEHSGAGSSQMMICLMQDLANMPSHPVCSVFIVTTRQADQTKGNNTQYRKCARGPEVLFPFPARSSYTGRPISGYFFWDDQTACVTYLYPGIA